MHSTRYGRQQEITEVTTRTILPDDGQQQHEQQQQQQYSKNAHLCSQSLSCGRGDAHAVSERIRPRLNVSEENVGSTLRSPQAVLYPSHYVVAAAAATRLDAFAMHSGEAHRTTGTTRVKPCGGFATTPVMFRWYVVYATWELFQSVKSSIANASLTLLPRASSDNEPCILYPGTSHNDVEHCMCCCTRGLLSRHIRCMESEALSSRCRRNTLVVERSFSSLEPPLTFARVGICSLPRGIYAIEGWHSRSRSLVPESPGIKPLVLRANVCRCCNKTEQIITNN